jgi:hypothetical protein
MTYTSPDDYRATSLSDWDPAPTREQRQPPTPRRGDDEFRADEVINATRIKLQELRTEMKKADKATIEACMAAVGQVLAEREKKLRAEFEREMMQLRIEFLQQQLDATRSVTKLKTVTPSGSMIA